MNQARHLDRFVAADLSTCSRQGRVLRISARSHGSVGGLPMTSRVSERPFIPRGPSSTAFDAQGVATRERDIIENGVLTGYVLGSYSARRLGLETTGNAGGVHNLIVGPGRFSAKELMEQMA